MKNKMWLRRVAAFVLCAALVLLLGVFPKAQAKTLDELKQEYNQLQQEIEANKKKLESIKNEQATNEEKLTVLSNQADAIAKQLEVINSELSALNADIAQFDREIAELDKKINDLQAQIDSTQEKISERLRATYMAGSSSWIEILLESDSISSLLLRIQLLASVTENDNKLIAEFEKQTESLNKSKEELDKKRAELVEKKSELDKKNADLAAKQSDYNANYLKISNIMTALDKSSAAYQYELQKQYQKREAFERQIDRLVSGGSQSGDGDGDFFNDGVMMWPVPYQNSYISAGYGYYDPEGDGTYTMHSAIDIVVRENGVNVSYGKKIVAAQSGKVLTRGYSDVGGNYLTIDHGDGYRTYYGHCSQIIVSAGERVEKGEVIAYMGATGYVTGPHVHFQVMQVKNGVVTRLNPLNFVTPPN